MIGSGRGTWAGEYGDEFIAAQAGEDVGIGGYGPQPVGCAAEAGVARGEAVPLVHLFEADDVAHDEGEVICRVASPRKERLKRPSRVQPRYMVRFRHDLCPLQRHGRDGQRPDGARNGLSGAIQNYGDEGDRTLNPRLAKAVLSQLSYVPGFYESASAAGTADSVCFRGCDCGLRMRAPRFELGTSTLSGRKKHGPNATFATHSIDHDPLFPSGKLPDRVSV